MAMNDELRSTVIRSLDRGIRYDGREGLSTYRPISLSTSISCNAEGSAKVQIGGTVVLVGVKMAVEQPYPDAPDKGTLMVNVELLALSNPEFEPGPPGENAVELARVVDRGIREAGVIQMEKLCLSPAEKVWSVMIDVCTLNDEGNLFDAASLGALLALRTARIPGLLKDVYKADYKQHTKPLPLNEMPISVTVLKIGQHYIVDPCTEEWEVYDSRLTVASLEDGTICAMQKGGASSLMQEDVDRMIGIALEKAGELRAELDRVK